jgi:hypothetical protein
VGDPAAIAKLIDRALEVGEPAIHVPWYQLAKGLSEYRAGRPEEAAKHLDQSRQSLASPAARATADLLLAMAYKKAGREDSARAAAEQSRRRFDGGLVDPPPYGAPFELDSSFENWLIYWIVLREAEATLGPLMPKPPTTQPAPGAGAGG